MRLTSLFLSALLFSGAAHSEVYKCIVGGKTSYQDHPCDGSKADENVIKVTTPKALPNPGDKPVAEKLAKYAEETHLANQRSDINRKIEEVKREMRVLQSQMDAEMDALRLKKLRATNNIAGATYEQSISQEMQAVAATYDAKLRTKTAEIDRYRKELDDLK